MSLERSRLLKRCWPTGLHSCCISSSRWVFISKCFRTNLKNISVHIFCFYLLLHIDFIIKAFEMKPFSVFFGEHFSSWSLDPWTQLYSCTSHVTFTVLHLLLAHISSSSDLSFMCAVHSNIILLSASSTLRSLDLFILPFFRLFPHFFSINAMCCEHKP